MAKIINPVVISTDTFSSLITKTNQVISALGSEIITANSSVNGANTTGNTNLIGIFGANTVAVGSALRGGTVNAAANLNISSNTTFTGANASFSANLVITNTVTSVNAITMFVTGPTLNVSSNTTFSGNVNISGTRLTIVSNTGFTGANTTLASPVTNITSNTLAITSNTVNITSNAVNVTSNTLFTGSIEVTENITMLGELRHGPDGMDGIDAHFSNSNIGATTGSPISVYNWEMMDYKCGDITSVIKNGSTVRVSKLMIVADGTNVFLTEYATLHSPANANLGVYSVTANTTHAILRFNQTASNSELTLNVTLIT